jgi:hypothetical protein
MRIYLDTNILTKLDDHPKLKRILDQYSEYLNIVYSEAHIDDLSRSGNLEKTIEDLIKIRELTHGQCMAKYLKQQHVTYEKRDPVEFYETTLETSFSLANLDGLEQAFSGIDFAALGMPDPVEALNLAMATFEETVLDNLSSPEYDYSSLFKQSGQQPSLKSLISDMMNLVNGSPEANAFYRYARTMMDEHVEQRKSLSNQTDPIAHLNSILPGSAMGRSFEEFNAMAMEIGKTNIIDQGEKERFVTSYSNLDLMGFRSDSKMSVQNINTDATHAYFAGHCEVFITQDQKLSAKAGAVYREFGTDTLIMDVAQAVKLIPELIPLTNTVEDLIAEIGTHYEADVSQCHSEVETRITSMVRNLDKFLLGFFDEYLEHTYPEGSFLSVYYKGMPTLNRWYFSREYELLTNKLVAILGHDNNGNGKFGDGVSEFQGEDQLWRGRYWGNNFQIVLKHTQEFGLSLFINSPAETEEQNSGAPTTGPG